MFNRLQEHKTPIFGSAKRAFVASSLFALLIAGSPVSAQTVKYNEKNSSGINTVRGDALTFTANNITTYYPDMKEHFNTMVNNFWDQEHKDAVTALLNTMVANIKDPKQKTGDVIGVLEYSVFHKSIFGDKHGNDITEETFKYIEKFDTDYKLRFKGYYARLTARTEELKQKLEKSKGELEESRKELNAMLYKFKPNDIKTIPGMKARIVKVEKLYTDNGFEITNYFKMLFDAAK